MKYIASRYGDLLGLLLFGLSACATFIHGTEQKIWITSDPADATVRVDGVQMGTPNFVSLLRHATHTVTAEKEGCTKEQVKTSRGFNYMSTLLGNAWLLAWIPAGIIVDLISGGDWSLEPDHVHVVLLCSPMPTGSFVPSDEPKHSE
jgi:hypothetical protein